MAKKIVWTGRAKAGPRAIDRETAIVLLHDLARFISTGEGEEKRLQEIDAPELRLRLGDYRIRFRDLATPSRSSTSNIASKPTAETPVSRLPFHRRPPSLPLKPDLY